MGDREATNSSRSLTEFDIRLGYPNPAQHLPSITIIPIFR